jgi:signal peptidase II
MQGTGGAPLTSAQAYEAAPDAVTDPDHDAARASRRRVLLLAVVAVGVVAADVVSKVLVVAHLSDRGPVTLIPHVLDLELTRNSGAAFSLGAGVTIVFTLVALGVALAIVRTASRLVSTGWAVALGLLLGGAVGNLIDRFVRSPGPGRGAVVDWIHLHHWPVFNIADSGIVVGAILAGILTVTGVPATRDSDSPDGQP